MSLFRNHTTEKEKKRYKHIDETMSVKLLSAHMCSLVFFGVDPQVHQATAIMKWSKSESSGMDAFDRMDLAVRERKKERKKEREDMGYSVCTYGQGLSRSEALK